MQNSSIQFCRPRLKSGQVFGSLTSNTFDSALLFELQGSGKQVSLPSEAAAILPLLDGIRTIPEIMEALHHTHGRVPFKVFFGALQKLQANGCLEGAEVLVTEAVRQRAEMFERPPLWITRPIVKQQILAGSLPYEPIHGSSSFAAYLFFALGLLIFTLTLTIHSWVTGAIGLPSGYLHIERSYVKGVVFFFFSASLILTMKTLLKASMSYLLTGARSALNLELGLFSLALRNQDDKIYMATGRLLSTLSFVTVSVSYFFVFAVAVVLSKIFVPNWGLLDDLFWTTLILAVVDLNPFRQSDLSGFFNTAYNKRSAPELLPYLRNRGLLAIGRRDQVADSSIYTAYSILAIGWTMFAYNILLVLITQNDTLLISTLLETIRGTGPFAEALAAGLIGASLLLSLVYLGLDFITTVLKNVMSPLRTKLAQARSKRAARNDAIESAEAIAQSIRHLPLFTGLHPDTVLFLLSHGKARRYRKDTHIIVQDTPSEELYLLLEGEVAIRKRHATGATQELARFQAPTVFGENTLLSNAPRSADVVSCGDVRVVAISRQTIHELVTHPSLQTQADLILDRLVLGQYIASSDLFREAPREVASLFFNQGEILSVSTGRQIIEQGRTDKDFYLLIRGSVDVFTDGRLVTTLQQGDFFGEMALILNSPRSATIITREPSRILKLSAARFWQILTEHTEVALYLESVSESRVNELTSGGGPTC
ncbi:MAG: cyclic nucleotide-binding domain-containing protein [Bdellovibrionales bacterium]|jgi:CRP-like cAMP-binding protein|nr:cyclic nucleotide-binding domain-containing protein [Bdellovibrionales bacterium]